MSKLTDKVIKNKLIENAMILGIVSAKQMGLDKPCDIATSVKFALKNANFVITRKRS